MFDSSLQLDIYCVTLATEGLTDAVLMKAMTAIPAGGIVVMEDVDVALSKAENSLNREEQNPSNISNDDTPTKSKGKKNSGELSNGGGITLSGEQQCLSSREGM